MLKEITTKGQKPAKKASSRRKKQDAINPLEVDPSILESSKDESEVGV
jgi:hypothetical protein